MKIGLIGLGKMGYNLALNMLDHNIEVIGYDKYINEDVRKSRIQIKESLQEMIKHLEKPRVIWMMVPAGDITESVLNSLKELLSEEDIIIDGGNSRYTDTVRRANELKEMNLHFLDVGTSGGTSGARNGASLMIGGEREVFEYLEPIFQDLATDNGYGYMGKNGAGHFVKMVHNGIEYGMMQAIGEGFDLLQASPFELDYQTVSKVWANGSIIEGLLMRMVQSAFEKDETLSMVEGRVDDSGEGQWTIEEALQLKVSIPVIAHSLFARYKSKDDNKFAEKIVAAMRGEFGGHKVHKK
jgi:6-phosphogluconate dehydrogenase